MAEEGEGEVVIRQEGQQAREAVAAEGVLGYGDKESKCTTIS